MLAGADSLTELDTICSRVTEILHSGGFPLAKWASNRHNQSGESDANCEVGIRIAANDPAEMFPLTVLREGTNPSG
ncbi:hypothetical protein ACLKA6_008639 [Drosophila palustris]